MQGVSLPAAKDFELKDQRPGIFTGERVPAMRWLNLRRRRASNLPIRGISREWAISLFSGLCVSVVNQGL